MSIKITLVFSILEMFTLTVVSMLDIIIGTCQYLKRYLQNDKYEYLLNESIGNIKLLQPICIKCTRHERHILYKKFKGRYSKFSIQSCGKEDKNTCKLVYIKMITKK